MHLRSIVTEELTNAQKSADYYQSTHDQAQARLAAAKSAMDELNKLESGEQATDG